MSKNSIFIRNINSDLLIEIFLVSAVSAFLLIRFYLEVTGYPAIGGGHLHIAHMLWGGLLMLISIFILLIFINRRTAELAALFGGLGFGIFIDELGKFLTSDNNYFFQPTIALIYIVFILIYISVRAIKKGKLYTEQEYLINSIEALKEAVLSDLDKEEKTQALMFLKKTDQKDALVQSLTRLVGNLQTIKQSEPAMYTKVKGALRTIYNKIVSQHYFTTTIIGFFVIYSLVNMLDPVFLLIDINKPTLRFTEIVEVVFSAITGIVVLRGVLAIRHSRLRAFRFFRQSVLITIFLTQVFSFYTDQFRALIGLSWNIVILLVLEYMISQEEQLVREKNLATAKPEPNLFSWEGIRELFFGRAT